MKWNMKKLSRICWERLGHPCAQAIGNGSCMRCMVVKDFFTDPCDIKMDHQAHEHMDEFVAFLIRVANAGSRRC